MSVPAAGTRFTYRGSSYRVSGWLKPDPNPSGPQQKCGPDRCKVVFCLPAEAVYVSGSGVGGCIARVEDIEVIGMVTWTEERLAEEQRSAEAMAGMKVW